MKIYKLLGAIFLVSLASGCTQLSEESPPSFDSGSYDSSSSDSSEPQQELEASALADCQAYQSGYNSVRFSDFLETEWDAFSTGNATVFKSQDFQDLWTTVQNGNFPTWDDVGYVVYELCWDAADFEITIPIVEEETVPSQPSVQYVEVPNIVGVLDGQAKTWLFQNGYGFSFDVKSTGFNPRISCLMSGTNLVLEQSPPAGSLAANNSSTRLTAFVSCES